MTPSQKEFQSLVRDPDAAADFVREAMTQRTALALTPDPELQQLRDAVKMTSSPDRQALLAYVDAEMGSRQ